MASDSDLDEDELLQMALKEQSERDINYHRQSKPAKPVVNLVQAPPPPPFMRMNNSNPMPNARSIANSKGNHRDSKGGADDDDDSEVELLSISSGDEESSRDLGVTQKGRPQRRGSIDDDRAEDGGEPQSWKRVDESEVRVSAAQLSCLYSC